MTLIKNPLSGGGGGGGADIVNGQVLPSILPTLSDYGDEIVGQVEAGEFVQLEAVGGVSYSVNNMGTYPVVAPIDDDRFLVVMYNSTYTGIQASVVRPQTYTTRRQTFYFDEITADDVATTNVMSNAYTLYASLVDFGGGVFVITATDRTSSYLGKQVAVRVHDDDTITVGTVLSWSVSFTRADSAKLDETRVVVSGPASSSTSVPLRVCVLNRDTLAFTVEYTSSVEGHAPMALGVTDNGTICGACVYDNFLQVYTWSYSDSGSPSFTSKYTSNLVVDNFPVNTVALEKVSGNAFMFRSMTSVAYGSYSRAWPVSCGITIDDDGSVVTSDGPPFRALSTNPTVSVNVGSTSPNNFIHSLATLGNLVAETVSTYWSTSSGIYGTGVFGNNLFQVASGGNLPAVAISRKRILFVSVDSNYNVVLLSCRLYARPAENRVDGVALERISDSNGGKVMILSGGG